MLYVCACASILFATQLPIQSPAKHARLSLVPQLGNPLEAESVEFSPNGRFFGTGSLDGTVTLWDVASGREIRSFTCPNQLATFALSGDGKILATGYYSESKIDLWDVMTGQRTHTLSGQEIEGSDPHFLVDGDTLATAGFNHIVTLWDGSSGRKISSKSLGTGMMSFTAFSWDGMSLASVGEDHSVTVWDLTTGKKRFSVAIPPNGNHWPDFSSDGKLLATLGDGGSANLWDVASGRRVWTFAGKGVKSELVKFSPNGRFLAVGGGNAISVWDLASRKELHSMLGASEVDSVAFSKDGLHIAVAFTSSPVTIWNTVDWSLNRVVSGSAEPPASIAVACSGSAFAIGYQTSVRNWSLFGGPQGSELLRASQSITSIAFSPSSKMVAASSVDGNVHLIELSGKKEVKALHGSAGLIDAISFSPDGKLIATGEFGQAHLWDVAGGHEINVLTGHSKLIDTIAFSPDGRIIATGSWDGTVKLWSKAQARELRTLQGPSGIYDATNIVNALAFSPTGSVLASACLDGSATLWDLTTGRPLQTLYGSNATLRSIDFSPSGNLLAIASEDRTVSLWDAHSFKELGSLVGHAASVDSVVFSTDGRTIITGSSDGTAKMWDSSSHAELCSLIAFNDGTWAVVDPEGRFDVPDLRKEVWLSWVAGDAPLTPMPVTIFMRDFYEPGLLEKIWRREKLKPVKDVLSLVRAQPKIELSDPHIVGDQGQVTVTATAGTQEMADGTKQIGLPQDLHLSRDGRLVAQVAGPMKLDNRGHWSRVFTFLLPHNGGKGVELSAYSFNQSGVATDIARSTLKGLPEHRIGRAYVVSVGVNDYGRPDLRLTFAGADAQAMQAVLGSRIKGFEQVVVVPLINGKKQAFHDVLDELAGLKLDPTGKIARSTPDDMVILSWSGHGLTKVGKFYLLPSDVPNDPDTYGDTFLNACIDTDELADWLRGVDAGDMAFIIDACYSAAAIESQDFKPAPLGNRGLGQLAYDKGIRILAATQASDVALESARTGNGLLTYALVTDGLAAGKSPTLDEWLSAAVDRVPQLYDLLRQGTLKAAKGTRAVEVTKHSEVVGEREFRQRPALFSFVDRNTQLPFVGKR